MIQEISVGKILHSSPILKDSNFVQSQIFIYEKNINGAAGFVVNKLFSRAFNELIEFNQSLAVPLFEGGPVETDKLFFIHCRPDLIDGGNPIIGNIFLGGNFEQAVFNINNNKISLAEIKLFIGYCGWDTNQLEEELKEGSWLVQDYNSKLIFNIPSL